MKKNKPRDLTQTLIEINHDLITAMQSAWIETVHGRGAEAGMQWIENTLWGPGLLPDEDAPYSTEAQAWFDANRYEPWPKCFCGRPSNIVSMGKGFCCDEHKQQYRMVVSDEFQRYLRTGRFE